MNNFREICTTQAESWGWDLLKGEELASKDVLQKWHHHITRLTKMVFFLNNNNNKHNDTRK